MAEGDSGFPGSRASVTHGPSLEKSHGRRVYADFVGGTMAGTHRVLKDKNATRPFTLDTFTIVEFADRFPPDQESVREGSLEECVKFVRESVPPPIKE